MYLYEVLFVQRPWSLPFTSTEIWYVCFVWYDTLRKNVVKGTFTACSSEHAVCCSLCTTYRDTRVTGWRIVGVMYLIFWFHQRAPPHKTQVPRMVTHVGPGSRIEQQYSLPEYLLWLGEKKQEDCRIHTYIVYSSSIQSSIAVNTSRRAQSVMWRDCYRLPQV